MIQYNKKQMEPLIEKYQINAETNRLFAHILELFKEQPNYQVWGVGVVFSQVMPIGKLEDLCDWLKTYKSQVKNLTKQNIVAYRKKSDINMLFKEMRGIDMRTKVMSFISNFNTEQKNMLKSYLRIDEFTPLELTLNYRFKNFHLLAERVSKLKEWKKAKLFTNASNIHGNVSELVKRIKGALMESYDWEKEDCKQYIENNCPKCEIVFDNGPYMIVQIDSYESSEAICGHDRTSWCITNQKHMWDNYVERADRRRRQYFYFDFSKDENDELAHIGFTVEDGTGLVEAQTTSNKCLMGEGRLYNSQRVSIDDVFAHCGAKKSKFINLLKERSFGWNMEDVIGLGNIDGVTVIGQKNGMVILRLSTMKAMETVLGHTCIRNETIAYDSSAEAYAIINLALQENDDESIVWLLYSSDKWGSKSLIGIEDMYGTNLLNTQFLTNNDIHMEDYISFPGIDNNVLLHKLISEGSEDEVIKLLSEHSDIDINFQFDGALPIFAAMDNRMWNVFDMLYSNPKCDINATNSISGSILTTLLYLYLADEFDKSDFDKEEYSTKYIEKLVCKIIDDGKVDVNLENKVNDTALLIAAEFPQLNWALAHLVALKSLDVNKLDHFGRDAFDVAMTEGNTDAMHLLGMRPDLVISESVSSMAISNNIDLGNYIHPTNDVYKLKANSYAVV